MPAPRARPSNIERSIVFFGIALLAVASPLRLVWARGDKPWYAPFLVWLALVALAALAARRAPPAPRDEP